MMFSRKGLTILMVLVLSLSISFTSFGNGQKESTAAGEQVTLSYWIGISNKVAGVVKSYDEMPVFQQMEKDTGIHIEFQHPPAGQANEQFNLMVASGDLADMIYWNWTSFPGGPSKAIKDGTIIALNDQFTENAPDILATFDKYPQAKKDAMLDDGTFYMVPFIKPDRKITSYNGYQVRGDWLETLGMDVPETIDDWYKMLTAMKENDVNKNGDANDEIPFVSTTNNGTAEGISMFTGSWGLSYDFFVKDGKIKYGPIEDGFKDYLATMRKWYSESLIDSEVAITDGKQFQAKVTNSIAGSYYGLTSGNMGKFMSTMVPEMPEFELVAVPYPIGPAGKSYNNNAQAVNAIPGVGIGITTKNKHIKESIEWANYAYTSEGDRLVNFGIENESYTMKNGVPTYTDMIFKNPNGLTPTQAVGMYTLTHSGHALYASGYYTQMLIFPQQVESLDIWGAASTELIIPAITPTSSESSELASIVNDITTYKNEMVFKFIMGQASLDDEFDNFVKVLKGMNVEKAIKIQQDALIRYNNR
jgi:putative aldouronate transport system substrate-binding protein